MFWLIYIFFSLIFSYLIGSFFKGKIKKLMIFSTLVILLTPAQIEIVQTIMLQRYLLFSLILY